MDKAWLARARWRRRGAWLWPTFVVAVLFDAAIVCVLPITGSSQSFFGGLVAGMFFSLVAVVLCSRPLGVLVRRARPDLPVLIARDYAGTFAVLVVSAVIVTGGLLHRSTLDREQSTLRDAVSRAAAFIGARAPAQFAANATHTDTYTIQSGAIYRICAPSRYQGSRYYCVIVKDKLPFAQSVVYAGSEPNQVMAEGTN